MAAGLPCYLSVSLARRSRVLRRTGLQSSAGYELVGAFQNDQLIGVIGMRPVHTLARGAYLHVDDFVVSAEARRSGAGTL
ncbi:GNAT family N-acetyltransferase [Caballeronia catudaia]|uniref:GNAT family N-acetyltransferase n=1 Tax=Caballeronia catudaia TaxID=1777136 RepID=UPI002E150831|nr:GNAT family N-acetyltransferase [Caballeronia catudaia]